MPPGVNSKVMLGSCFSLSEDEIKMQTVGDGFVFSTEITFRLHCDRTTN